MYECDFTDAIIDFCSFARASFAGERYKDGIAKPIPTDPAIFLNTTIRDCYFWGANIRASFLRTRLEGLTSFRGVRFLDLCTFDFAFVGRFVELGEGFNGWERTLEGETVMQGLGIWFDDFCRSWGWRKNPSCISELWEEKRAVIRNADRELSKSLAAAHSEEK